MIKTDVYERHGHDDLSRNAFYAVMGVVLTWGFVATYYVSSITQNMPFGLMETLFIGLLIPIIGIVISMSENALISFVGFNMVVIPFGATLGPVLKVYGQIDPTIVTEAASMTGAITVLMGLTGLAFPSFYRSIGGFLFVGLLALLGVMVLGFFIPALAGSTVVSYLAAGLFALYIGYDMHRASEIPATLDNAVDVCISLYLDIINLFLHLLRIVAASRD